MRKISMIIAIIVSVVIFMGWMILVGNPHVVETILGLIISTIIGVMLFFKLSPKSR